MSADLLLIAVSAGDDPITVISWNRLGRRRIVNARDEMLSLTDMWRAAGGDPSKRPGEWLRQDATKAFVECVAGSLEVGQAHIQTSKGGRGIGGATFAHWQIGLAYAKYLSPAFHMWCNTVVRERMEGQAVDAPAGLVETLMRDIGRLRSIGARRRRGFPSGRASLKRALPSSLSR